jgi:hypothetical protein
MIIACLVLATAVSTSSADPKPDLKRLANDRVAAVKKVIDLMAFVSKNGGGGYTQTETYVWSVRMLDAELDATTDAKAKTKALQDHVDRMTAIQVLADSHYKAALGGANELAEADYFLAEAKLWAARGKK